MDFLSYLLLLITVALLAMLTGLTLHETTHYVVGRLDGGNPSYVLLFGIAPQAVTFENIDSMSRQGVRATGASVLIWPILTIIWYINVGFPANLFEIYFFLSLLGASIVSPSDFLGMVYPDRWKDFAKTTEEGTHREAIAELLKGRGG